MPEAKNTLQWSAGLFKYVQSSPYSVLWGPEGPYSSPWPCSLIFPHTIPSSWTPLLHHFPPAVLCFQTSTHPSVLKLICLLSKSSLPSSSTYEAWWPLPAFPFLWNISPLAPFHNRLHPPLDPRMMLLCPKYSWRCYNHHLITSAWCRIWLLQDSQYIFAEETNDQIKEQKCCFHCNFLIPSVDPK